MGCSKNMCNLVWNVTLSDMKNKVETSEGIHSLNFVPEKNTKCVQKPSSKGPLTYKCNMHWKISLNESKESLRSSYKTYSLLGKT
jgi:hypothetical protein